MLRRGLAELGVATKNWSRDLARLQQALDLATGGFCGHRGGTGRLVSRPVCFQLD